MRRRRGFTFIEITFVILIIGMLMAISLPRMKGTLINVRLKSGARSVTALLRYARNAAVLRGLPCSVCFAPEKDTYELVLLDEKGSRFEEKRRRRDRKKAALEIGSDAKGVRALPKDIHFAVIYTDAPLTEDKLPCVTYFADGSATPATISIQDSNEQAISVEVFQTTGMARVQKGLPVSKPKTRKLYYGPDKH
jgi:prepilin-type N-terminal cleavage/methylation domain-containing protein